MFSSTGNLLAFRTLSCRAAQINSEARFLGKILAMDPRTNTHRTEKTTLAKLQEPFQLTGMGAWAPNSIPQSFHGADLWTKRVVLQRAPPGPPAARWKRTNRLPEPPVHRRGAGPKVDPRPGVCTDRNRRLPLLEQDPVLGLVGRRRTGHRRLVGPDVVSQPEGPLGPQEVIGNLGQRGAGIHRGPLPHRRIIVVAHVHEVLVARDVVVAPPPARLPSAPAAPSCCCRTG